MATHLVNLVSPKSWATDDKKYGWLVVNFWGEQRWARPKFPPGILYPISQAWLDKYWEYFGIFVETIHGSNTLCWSGFTLNDKDSYPTELQSMMDNYPNVSKLFTDKWDLTFSNEDGGSLSIAHVEGTSTIVITSNGNIDITSEGNINLNGDASSVLTNKAICQFTGGTHIQGVPNVKAG